MQTYFAPAERVSEGELMQQINFVSHHPILNAILCTCGGFVAVVNEQRQVLALNMAFLEILGATDPAPVLGLRPGEMINCVHACDMPGGCGTGEYCITCGAAVAMVLSLSQNTSVEKVCSLIIQQNGRQLNLYFRVRSVPIVLEQRRLLVLFFQDISQQQKWALLERAFFHDLNNILSGLLGTIKIFELQVEEKAHSDVSQLVQDIQRQSLHLAEEIRIQRFLTDENVDDIQPVFSRIKVKQIFREVKKIFANHPAAVNRRLLFPKTLPDRSLRTNLNLIIRVLSNMLINAFEATPAGGTVKLRFKANPKAITFSVWNQAAIPAPVAKRIFQQNFSTRTEMGRGLGTYSMKLIGEQILGGQVDFDSSEAKGTTFRLTLLV